MDSICNQKHFFKSDWNNIVLRSLYLDHNKFTKMFNQLVFIQNPSKILTVSTYQETTSTKILVVKSHFKGTYYILPGRMLSHK